MRRDTLRGLALAVGLLLQGCAGVETAGLGVGEPQVGKYTLRRFVTYVEVDSLRPLFRWESFDPRDLDPETDLSDRVSDVTYELRIWEQAGGGSELILRRDGIVGTEFTPKAPLRPDTRHLWTLRAWFMLDGKRRATNWSLAGDPLEKEAVPNLSCLRFQTPAE